MGRLTYPQDASRAKRHFASACTRNNKPACAALLVAYGDKRPVAPDLQKKRSWDAACRQGSTRDCVMAGLMEAAGKMPAKASFDRACRSGGKFACELAKRVKK